MFDALAQALLCAVLFVLFRWGLHRTDALGRPDRFPAVALVLLLVPTLVLGSARGPAADGAAPPRRRPPPSSSVSTSRCTARRWARPSSTPATSSAT